MKYESRIGKFDSNVDEYVYLQALEGADAEVGSVQDFGWYGLMIFDEPVTVVQEIQPGITKEWEFSAAIISENDQGLVHVEPYDTAAEAKGVWVDVEGYYEKWLEDVCPTY